MSTPLVTRNITTTSQGANGQTITGLTAVTSTFETNLSETVAASSSNAEFAFTCPYSALQSLDISASAACTILFNSTSAPIATYNMAAGQLCHWDADLYATNATTYPKPLSANSTAVYVTCTNACVLNISAAYN